MALSLSQQQALALAPTIAACVSLICSSIITSIILRDPKKRAKVYHRLLLGMSLSDICTSIWWSASTRPIPPETGILWANGNTQTCTAQGFFLQLGIANPLYNMSLSVFYLLTVKVRWSEERVRKVEPLFHLCPLLWGSGTAIAGLFLEIFNSANLWCWIADYPGRNENANIYRLAFFYFPLWFAIVVVTINLVRLFRHVQRITKASEKHIRPSTYEVDEEEHNNHDDDADADAENLYDQGFGESERTEKELEDEAHNRMKDPEQQQQQQQQQQIISASQRTDVPTANTTTTNSTSGGVGSSGYARSRRKLAWQFLRYALAFYATWTPVTLLRFLQAIKKDAPFALLLLAAIGTPLQGLPNFLVYLYPQFLEKVKDWHLRPSYCRGCRRKLSWCWCCCCCLSSFRHTDEGTTSDCSPPSAQQQQQQQQQKQEILSSQKFHNDLIRGMEKRGMLHHHLWEDSNSSNPFHISCTASEERRLEIIMEDKSAEESIYDESSEE